MSSSADKSKGAKLRRRPADIPAADDGDNGGTIVYKATAEGQQRHEAWMTKHHRARWPLPCSVEVTLLCAFTVLCIIAARFFISTSLAHEASVEAARQQPQQPPQHDVSHTKPLRIVTKDELAQHGPDASSIWVSILGEVFDVTDGKEYYGEGSGYSAFAGRDASRAFITGDFNRDLHDDVADLAPRRCMDLVKWVSFYHEKYKHVGVLVGRMFDDNGHKTPLRTRMERDADAAKLEEQRQKEADKLLCHRKWSAEEGGTAWCDDGKFPRLIMEVGSSGQPEQRCMCFDDPSWSDTRRLYDGCAPDATSCVTAPPLESN